MELDNKGLYTHCLALQGEPQLQQTDDEVPESILAWALHQLTEPSSYLDFAYWEDPRML